MLTRLLVATVATLMAHGSAWAQGTNHVQGMWTLASSVVERDGTVTDQFGPGVRGMMSLDAQGRFMFTIIGADLPKFASNSRATGTSEENKAVVTKSIAVFGAYSVESCRQHAPLQNRGCHVPQLGCDGAEAIHCDRHRKRAEIYNRTGVERRQGYCYMEARRLGTLSS